MTPPHILTELLRILAELAIERRPGLEGCRERITSLRCVLAAAFAFLAGRFAFDRVGKSFVGNPAVGGDRQYFTKPVLELDDLGGRHCFQDLSGRADWH